MKLNNFHIWNSDIANTNPYGKVYLNKTNTEKDHTLIAMKTILLLLTHMYIL